jgi:hypothetical protein
MSLGLSWDEFTDQLAECNIGIRAPVMFDAMVVIRDVDGDFHVAACWRDGNLLILDKGQAYDARKERDGTR